MARPTPARKPRSLKAQSDPLMENISRNVRVLLGEHDMTRTELARILGIGQDTLSRNFNGGRAWTIGELNAVAHLFDIELGQLVSDSLVVRNRCFRQGEFAFAA